MKDSTSNLQRSTFNPQRGLSLSLNVGRWTRDVGRAPFDAGRWTRDAQRSPTAFTLVELLVVVGIITILVAIIVPSFEAAMTASKRSNCAANLGQIGKAITAYVGDSETSLYPQTPR